MPRGKMLFNSVVQQYSYIPCVICTVNLMGGCRQIDAKTIDNYLMSHQKHLLGIFLLLVQGFLTHIALDIRGAKTFA